MKSNLGPRFATDLSLLRIFGDGCFVVSKLWQRVGDSQRAMSVARASSAAMPRASNTPISLSGVASLFPFGDHPMRKAASSPADRADIRRATEDAELRSCPSSHPIGGANSQLQFWQSFPPSFGVLGRNYCSPANFARRETACFDLATNRRQSNSIPTRELIERIGSLHVALLPGS